MNKLEVVTTIATALYWFAVSFWAIYVSFFYGLIWSAIFFGLMYIPYLKLIKWILEDEDV